MENLKQPGELHSRKLERSEEPTCTNDNDCNRSPLFVGLISLYKYDLSILYVLSQAMRDHQFNMLVKILHAFSQALV